MTDRLERDIADVARKWVPDPRLGVLEVTVEPRRLAGCTTSTPTTMSPPVAAQLPTPPFMAARGPNALPTVAPVPAPTDPSATSPSPDAAVQAR